MIAENNLSYIEQPNFSVSNTNVITSIIDLMKQTVPFFKSYLCSDYYSKRKLCEDEFSQIFTEQAQILIRKKDFPFNVSCQYRDFYNCGKGYPDIYFYPNEQNVSTESLFVVECKRLPAPVKAREKEYVKGENKNGGIERFKLGIHGKGLETCGILGYIENENYKYWQNLINKWIYSLAETDDNWNNNEILYEKELNGDYCLLESVAYSTDITKDLIHMWIMLSQNQEDI